MQPKGLFASEDIIVVPGKSTRVFLRVDLPKPVWLFGWPQSPSQEENIINKKTA